MAGEITDGVLGVIYLGKKYKPKQIQIKHHTNNNVGQPQTISQSKLIDFLPPRPPHEWRAQHWKYKETEDLNSELHQNQFCALRGKYNKITHA